MARGQLCSHSADVAGDDVGRGQWHPMPSELSLTQSPYLIFPSIAEVDGGKIRGPLAGKPPQRTGEQRNTLYKSLLKDTFLDSQTVIFFFSGEIELVL